MSKYVINFIMVLASIVTVTIAIIAIAKPSTMAFMSLAISMCCLTATLVAVRFANRLDKHNQ